MDNAMQNQHYQNRLTILGILFLVNLALFIIPGFPGSIPDITANVKGTAIPDMRLGYDADELFTFLTDIGLEGRIAFQRMHLTIDLFFPLIYGLLLCLLIHHFSDRSVLAGKHLYLLGISPALFDLFENFSLVYITSQYPDINHDLADIIQIFTYGKFFELLFLICFIFFLGLRYWTNRNKEVTP
jgi:hypothetical protein